MKSWAQEGMGSLSVQGEAAHQPTQKEPVNVPFFNGLFSLETQTIKENLVIPGKSKN